MKYDVLIVGAGAAGLMAAYELSRAGKKVLVLEARDRIGGRIYPLRKEEFGYEAAGGAEFIHGEAPITKSLCKELGLTLTNPTEWWSVRNGEPVKVDGISPHDPLFETKLKALAQDMPVQQFLNTYFPAGTYDDLRDTAKRWVEGYSAADTNRASTFTLREEMTDSARWLQTSISEGYGAIIRHLRAEAEKFGAEFVLNKPVASIDYSTDEVATTCSDTTIYRSEKVVVTVPLPLLKEIVFAPAIPKELAAAEDIGYGAVIKIILKFKNAWWTNLRGATLEHMFFLLSKELVPTWWTQYPEQRTTLTGWLPGPHALELSSQPDEKLLTLSLESLKNIFNIPVEELQGQLITYQIVNWPRDPWARGVYSYTTPKTAAAVAVLQQPIENKIYFAGEAIDRGYSAGTVEGAFVSASQATKKILGS